MYCFIDDLLTRTRPVWARPADPRRHLSDAQVLTTALVAARYFGGNLVLGQHYMEQHWGQKSLDKSGFNRQLHALADTLAGLFAPLAPCSTRCTPRPATSSTRSPWPCATKCASSIWAAHPAL